MHIIHLIGGSFMLQSQAQVDESLSIQDSAHYQPVPGPSSLYGKEIDIVIVHVHVKLSFLRYTHT